MSFLNVSNASVISKNCLSGGHTPSYCSFFFANEDIKTFTRCLIALNAQYIISVDINAFDKLVPAATIFLSSIHIRSLQLEGPDLISYWLLAELRTSFKRS